MLKLKGLHYSLGQITSKMLYKAHFNLEAIPWFILSNLTMIPIVKFILNTKNSHILHYQNLQASQCSDYRFLVVFADNILWRKQ